MQQLNLPPYPFRITKQNDTFYIYDEIRKKDIKLTPEEWVRQHFLQWLIVQKKYPKALIQIEKGLKLNKQKKRTDILIFNNLYNKEILVECKAPEIIITQKTFDQIARYNLVHKVNFLVVTNGMQHFFCKMDYPNNTFYFIEDLPEYFSKKS